MTILHIVHVSMTLEYYNYLGQYLYHRDSKFGKLAKLSFALTFLRL